MLTPAPVDLFADRWTPFVETLRFTSADLSRAIFRAQIRIMPDAPGAALVTLGMAADILSDGFFVLSATGSGDDAVTDVQMRIGDVTALPVAVEPGRDAVIAWDLHLTQLGFDRIRAVAGRFTIRAGSTRP